MKSISKTPTLKKVLLGGMSVLAFTAMVSNATVASAADLTMTTNEEWKDGNDAGSDVTDDASAGDNVNIVTHTLTVDDTGAGTAVGTVTGTTGTLKIIGDGGAAAATVGAVTLTGAGNIEVLNKDNQDGDVSATLASVNIGGAVTLNGANDTQDDLTSLTVTGDYVVTGATTITSQDGAGGGAALNAVKLTLGGATVTATGGISIEENTGSIAIDFNGSADQAVTGVIDGATAAEGTVNVIADGKTVTFASKVGSTNGIAALNVGSASVDSNAVFNADVKATAIQVGNASSTAGAAYTADFNGNIVGALTVDTGDTATETASVTVAGNITGTTTLDDNEGTIDATLTFDGTSAQTVTGDIVGGTAGDGLVVVSNTSGVTVSGDMGGSGNNLGAARVASGATLTVTATGTGDGLAIDGNLDADGAGARGGTVVLNAEDSAVGTTADGDAVSTIGDAAGDAHVLTALTMNGGAGATNSTVTAAGRAGQTNTVTVNGTADITTVTVAGGTGSNGADNDASNTGGAGGTSTVTFAQALTATTVNVNAGATGTSGVGGGAEVGAVGGAGGVATLNIDTASTITTLNVNGAAGAAGAAGSGANHGGAGTAGANAVVDLDAVVTGNLVLTAGAGGAGGAADAGAGNGGNGGNGGDALATISTNFTGNITLDDGAAGAAGAAGTGTAGTAGTGGSAQVTFDGAAAQTVSGTVTAAADGEGTIVVNDATVAQGTDAVIFSSAVGTSSAAVGTLTQTNGDVKFASNAYIKTITGGAGHDLDFDGNVVAATALNMNTGVATFAGDVTASTKFDFAADGTMTLDGAAAQTITGAITATTDNNGTINVTNTAGVVTFANNVGAAGTEIKEVAVAASASAKFDGVVQAETIDIDGTVEVTNDGHAADVQLEIADGSKIILGAGVVDTETVFTVGDVVSAGTTTVEAPSNFTSGTITLADSTADASGDIANMSVTDTALVDYALVASGNDITITATAKSAATTASELGVNTETATALSNANTAVATGDAAALEALTTALNAGGATAKTAAEQLTVQTDILSSSVTAAVGTGAAVVGVTSDRLASLRSGSQFASAQSGFATGDMAKTKAVWAQTFGNWISQDDKTENGGTAYGYDASTYGLAIGADMELNSKVRLGASFSYANTEVEGNGAGQAENDINSYQVTVYGDYTAEKFFVEGMVGFAMNENDASRKITVGGLNRTASGEYDSNQYMAAVKTGMPINLKGATYVTPTVGLAYTYVNSDSYTETGASGWNQTVDPDDVSVLIGSLGAKLHTKVKLAKGMLVPSVNAGISYDMIGDEASATGQYTGGGAAFVVEGAEVEQFGGNAGVGLAYEQGRWTVGANYDAEFKSDYVSQSAKLEARFKF